MSFGVRAASVCRSKKLLRDWSSWCASRARSFGPVQHGSLVNALALQQRGAVSRRRRILQSSEQRTHLSTPSHRQDAPPTSPSSTARVICTTNEHSHNHTIATLSISNPAKLNIVTTPLLRYFTAQCHHLSTLPTLRAVVLASAPTPPGKAPSWIGGADITEMAQLSSPAEARAFINGIHAACDAIRAIPVPVIASIDGFCLGAGMEIAASCDLRIATKDSVFGMPEVAVGIPSVVEAAYLPGLIGFGRTRRLLYLAERIDGVEAERWGFVERVVDDGEEGLRVATGEWVERLVEMGPRAVRSQKRLVQRWEELGGVREGIEEGASAFAGAFEDGGREPREFMGRFVGRRR